MNLRIWAIAALFLSLAACDPTNPDDPENELSDKAALLRLSFTPTDNPGMSSASTGVLSNGYYCISVTDGVDSADKHRELLISGLESAFDCRQTRQTT